MMEMENTCEGSRAERKALLLERRCKEEGIRRVAHPTEEVKGKEIRGGNKDIHS